MNGKSKALLLILLITLVLPATIALASSGGEYTGQIRVTNGGDAKAEVTGAFTLKTQNLINGDMLNDAATDAAVRTADETDVAFMPGINENPWIFEIPSISQNAEQYYYLYTKGVTGGVLRYFPDDAGMTTPADASLELGNDFIIEQRGYVNTDATAIVPIPNADMEDTTDWTGGSRSGTQKHGGDYARYLTATAASPNGNVPVYSTSYQDLEWVPEYAGQEFTLDGWIYCSQSEGTTPGWARLQIDDGVGTSSSDTVMAASWNEVDVTRTLDVAATRLRVIMQVFSGTGVWDGTYTSNAYFDDLAFMTEASGTGKLVEKEDAFRIYVYPDNITAEIVGTGISVTATGVGSGVRKVITAADTSNLTIEVYDEEDNLIDSDSTPLGVATVPLNGDWSFVTNGSMPYLEYQKIWVSSNLMQWVEWEYDSVFHDKSENGVHENDANPSFPTSTSDPDITIALLSFQPTDAQGNEPIFQPEGSWELVTELPDEPANLYGDMDMTFLGAGIIEDMADATDMPLAILVFGYALGAALFFGLLAYGLTMGKHGRGSLLVQSLVSLIILVYFVITGSGVIPAWVLLPFGFEALAAIMWRQTISPW